MAPRFLRPLPVPPGVAQPAHAVLADGEEWLCAQDDVGLYLGSQKIPTHQVLSVQLTTHRLLFICPPPAEGHLQLRLADIRQTEHYTGFLRSSPKITLHLGPAPAAAEARPREWTCRVCGFFNEPQADVAAAYWSPTAPCKLCGVSRPDDQEGTPPPTTPLEDTSQIACPRCTFFNNPNVASCEICGANLSRPAARQGQGTPVVEVVRISFRRGGDKDVYRRLKSVLGSRTWEARNGGGGGGGEITPGAAAGGERTATPSRGIGIDGILATIDLENRSNKDNVRDAFQDLEALMVRAGEMVKLVQSLNAKLSATGSTGTDPAEAETRTFLRSSLVQLGLPAPAVTEQDPGARRDEEGYLAALASELAGVLTGSGTGGEGLMRGTQGKGLVGMDEAWVIWNRTRGVCESPLRLAALDHLMTSNTYTRTGREALVSPQVMAKVVLLLPAHTPAECTVEKLRFLSGLEVLHTPGYSPRAFARRVRGRLDAAAAAAGGGGEPWITILDIALSESLSVALTGEMMAFVALIPDCGVVRDDGAAVGFGAGEGPVGERWHRDLIAGFVWDDRN